MWCAAVIFFQSLLFQQQPAVAETESLYLQIVQMKEALDQRLQTIQPDPVPEQLQQELVLQQRRLNELMQQDPTIARLSQAMIHTRQALATAVRNNKRRSIQGLQKQLRELIQERSLYIQSSALHRQRMQALKRVEDAVFRARYASHPDLLRQIRSLQALEAQLQAENQDTATPLEGLQSPH